jgi:hypothetical protein
MWEWMGFYQQECQDRVGPNFKEENGDFELASATAESSLDAPMVVEIMS